MDVKHVLMFLIRNKVERTSPSLLLELLKSMYQYGRNAYYGITIGKKIPLKNEKFNLEFFVGGGSSQSNYKYYNKDEQRIFAITNYKRKFNKSGEELPYRGGIMLTYKLK